MEKNATAGRTKVESLFDAGSFCELGAYRKRADGGLTGVVCGYGAIGGKLVYAFAQDSDRKKGAFDLLQAEKIESLYETAIKNGAPVIGIFDSAGAYVTDGASALSAYGKFLAVVSRASGVIPQIAVIGGICAGLAATVAACFDLVVTIKDRSGLFVNAPFLTGKEVGMPAYAAKAGLSSITAESEENAVAVARKLIDLLPATSEEGVYEEDTTDDANRTVSVKDDMKETISEIADAGTFLEISAGFADEMVTGLARFGGVACGIVANGTLNDGRISADGARKAAKLIRLCDAFGLPVITLIDSRGIDPASDGERAPLAAQLGKLAMSYATADTAKITVVIGKAYGAAFTLMGSRALGADVVYALPDAEISTMEPASAVAFLWNDRITETVSRDALVEEWIQSCASPQAAAVDGSVDDIIDPAELRQRICAAVYMLLEKNNSDPARKHCNLPL